jgi:fibronectin-binding autotransporter adhesin
LRPVYIAIATFCIVLSGCGGSSSTPTPTPTPVAQLTLTSGNWDFAAASSSGTNFLIGGNVVQTGTSITGGLHVINSACIAPSTAVPISGTISGQTATVTSAAVASQTINATLSGSATSLTGTYNVTGTGCAGGDKGNIAGVLVPSISGTWKGTLISNTVANPGVGVSATITESAADSTGVFALTGNATYTGSPCFASGTATTGSDITGRTTHVVLTNDDGSTVTFIGSLNNPAAPTQMNGTYTVTGGLCDGDSGTGQLTKQ